MSVNQLLLDRSNLNYGHAYEASFQPGQIGARLASQNLLIVPLGRKD
jgi:hypothetical protein